ncbi:uncharacterized protein LOC143223258 isoform X4 [Tachypleus tridentatus]|uniref:uncharacterized protein LOC143223258 isoform X4 n=1 Tax=Tachypleus tridentatus TaxID=6853 RepID=UPI003FD688EB
MSQLKRLVVSILQFLQDQLQSSLFAADAKECLEGNHCRNLYYGQENIIVRLGNSDTQGVTHHLLAMHCLETVFGVKFNDPSVAGLLASRPLLDIFTEVVRTEQSLEIVAQSSPCSLSKHKKNIASP